MSMKQTLRDMVRMLTAATPGTIERIALCESEGRLNDHLDALDGAVVRPVDGSHEYLPGSIWKKLRYRFQYDTIVRPFIRYTAEEVALEVVGLDNLRGVDGAIVCSNHVNKLDSVAIFSAFPRRTYAVAAAFNNMEGFLGEMMRVGGMLPLSDSFTAMKHLDSAITTLLRRRNFIIFFPEQSEWWCYKKPRPLMPGAYHYAVKNGVPVVPVFFTFRKRGEEATSLPRFVLHVLPPVYPEQGIPAKAAIAKLMEANERAWRETYESFYGERLSN
ncbi:MAG: lysophospholipid acyltransferase family protein [Christensenellaceae bacterium]